MSDVPVREYIERIFTERQAALEIAFKAQQNALKLATKNLNGRLKNLNELRQQVLTDRGLYLTRDRHDAYAAGVDARIGALEAWRNRAIGFGAAIAFIAGISGGIAVKIWGG